MWRQLYRGILSAYQVSMKSGLEDRNNATGEEHPRPAWQVSMKSGLEDRNNHS